MRSYRQFPATTVVKAGSFYYIRLAGYELGTDYGIPGSREPGMVKRVRSLWYGYARDTDTCAAVGSHKTLKAARRAVLTAFVRMLDEREAHEIQTAIATAQGRANVDAAIQRRDNGLSVPLSFVFPMGVKPRITGTNEALSEQLRAVREYMGRGQGSLTEFDVNAYVNRMIEHELIRRAEVEETYADVEL